MVDLGYNDDDRVGLKNGVDVDRRFLIESAIPRFNGYSGERSKKREIALFEADRPSLNADDMRGAVRREDHYSD